MADDIYIGGRQLKSPPVKPQWDTEDARKGDTPTRDAKFDISNPPAADLGHPLEQHFAKTGGARTQMGGHLRKDHPAIKISEN